MRNSLDIVVVAALVAGMVAARTAWSQESPPPSTATVYTANVDANSVSALDGTTLARVHPDIPTDLLPQAVAVSSDGSRVYTGNIANGLEGFSSITVIDANTNEPLTTVNFDEGSGISDIAVAPDGSKVYAAYIREGRVEAFDPFTSGSSPIEVPSATDTDADPEAIDILPDGSALFVLDVANAMVVKLLTADGSSPASVAVSPTATELRVSKDGGTLIVVGSEAAQFFSTDTLTPLSDASTTPLGTQVDAATAGANFYVLDTAWGSPVELAPEFTPRGGVGGTVVPGDAAIDVYATATGAYVTSIDLGAGGPDVEVLGIAVLSDASKAYVSFTSVKGAGVGAVDLASGESGPFGSTGGSYPRRIAVREAPATPVGVVSYFLPRIVALKLAGTGEDSLVASGFYDDGGLGPDYTQPVTVDVGGFDEVFTLVPNGKHTAYKFKGPRIRFAIVPNLRGSSRGRFRMKIGKTTLAGLVDPNQPVDFHFRATGLPDAQGQVVLTAGKYRLGKKRGALLSPAFFPARATATLRGPDLDTLSFKGGFATHGTTPASLGTVRFSFGTFSLTLPGSAFTKLGDKFKYTSAQGKTKISVVLDFLRETVTLKASKIEVGNVSGATAEFVLDAGAGEGAIHNTVRLGSKTPKKFY